MASAKDIHVSPISAQDANALVRRIHYSGKIAPNSQLHLGVFWKGRLEGAMQFGPSMDKRKIIGLVRDTGWNDFLELNRMAFSEALPRNSESRAIGIAMKMLRRNAPNVEWVISFADACQCGDGAIYRASGFVLTGIRENSTLWQNPATGETVANMTFTKGKHLAATAGRASMDAMRAKGFEKLSGYQLRYVRFLAPGAADRLTVPIIPFAKIDEIGASMYRGEARSK